MFDLTPTLETGRRIGRIEAQMTETDKLMALMIPLITHLLPLSILDTKKAVPLEGREVELDREDWPKQYKGGVNRCLGYDILWA